MLDRHGGPSTATDTTVASPSAAASQRVAMLGGSGTAVQSATKPVRTTKVISAEHDLPLKARREVGFANRDITGGEPFEVALVEVPNDK